MCLTIFDGQFIVADPVCYERVVYVYVARPLAAGPHTISLYFDCTLVVLVYMMLLFTGMPCASRKYIDTR